ncbi:MAG: tetratricopeptide repeat protein [bacterium]|nr:tetratricopeptide repeat protein [bacterium]
MARRFWKWVLIGCVTMILLAGAGVGSLYAYKQHRNTVWLETAEEAYAAGEWTEARNFYAKYIPQEPDNVALLLKYAQASLNIFQNRAASLSQALTAYNQALSHDPGNDEIREKVIDLYERMGGWDALEYRVGEWLAADPTNPEYKLLRAHALERLGRRDEAIDAYEELAADGSASAEVYGSLARLLRERGLEAQAEAVLEQAVERRPDDGLVYLELARHHTRPLDVAQVRRDLERAIELAPEEADILLMAAQLATMRRDTDRAVELGRRAVAAQPGRSLPYLALANTYANADRLDEAISLLDAVDRAMAVDAPELLITLADYLIATGRIDEADETIAFYVDAYPDQTPIQDYFVARKAIESGDAASAVSLLSPVTKRLPGFLPARYALAVAYLDTGQRDLARTLLEAYINDNPGDLRAQILLAQQFGRARGLREIDTRAKVILADEKSGPSVLLSAGATLLDSAMRSGKTKIHIGTIQQLLERAILADPQMVNAYIALAEALLAIGDADGAQGVLQRAVDAGVPSDELTLARAGIAVASNDAEAARNLCAEALSRSETLADDAVVWAGFFSRRNQADHAIALLTDTAENLGGEARVRLLVERASLVARLADAGRALTWLEEIAAEVPEDGDVRDRFDEAKLAVAQQLLREGTPEAEAKARQIVEEAREQGSESATLRTSQAMLLLRGDNPDYDRARELLDEAIRANPDDVGTLMAMTYVRSTQDDPEGAIEYAQRAVVLAPRLAAAQTQLAELQIKLGRYLEAERVLQGVLQTQPGNVRALKLLVSDYLAVGRLQQAEAAFERLLEAVGDDRAHRADLDRIRGRMLMARGNNAGAEAFLRELVKRDPSDFDAVRQLAVAVGAQGRSEEARRLLEDYASREGDDPASWVALGDFYLTMQSRESVGEASTALTRALLIDPEYLPALRGMIEVQLRQGAESEALRFCDRYLDQRPDEAQVLYRKAGLLARSPQTMAEALETVERVIGLDETPEALALRGLIRLSLEDYAEALSDLQTASRTLAAPGAEIDAGVAEAYLALGERDLAKTFYDSARQKVARGGAANPDRMQRLDAALSGEADGI